VDSNNVALFSFNQVYRGPTSTSGLSHYAPWGYYVIQPSTRESGNSYGY